MGRKLFGKSALITSSKRYKNKKKKKGKESDVANWQRGFRFLTHTSLLELFTPRGNKGTHADSDCAGRMTISDNTTV